jgi:hypothetical protein
MLKFGDKSVQFLSQMPGNSVKAIFCTFSDMLMSASQRSYEAGPKLVSDIFIKYLSSTKKQHISNSLRLGFYHPRCQEIAFSTFKSKIARLRRLPLLGQ